MAGGDSKNRTRGADACGAGGERAGRHDDHVGPGEAADWQLPSFPDLKLPDGLDDDDADADADADTATQGSGGETAPASSRHPPPPPPPLRTAFSTAPTKVMARPPKGSILDEIELPPLPAIDPTTAPAATSGMPRQHLTLHNGAVVVATSGRVARRRRGNTMLLTATVAALLALVYWVRGPISGGVLGGSQGARTPQPPSQQPALPRSADPSSSARAANAAGVTAFQARRYAEAVAAFRVAISQDPSLAAAYRGLGIALATMGRADEAVEHYRAYLQLNPQAVDAAEVRRLVADYDRTHALSKGHKVKQAESPPAAAEGRPLRR